MPEGICNYFECHYVFLRVIEPKGGSCALTFRMVPLPQQHTGFLCGFCNRLYWKNFPLHVTCSWVASCSFVFCLFIYGYSYGLWQLLTPGTPSEWEATGLGAGYR